MFFPGIFGPNECDSPPRYPICSADITLLLSSEALYEDESFSERELAALVASKVYYHLQEYNESMVLALGAGKLFKLDNGGEYEETIIGKLGKTFTT